MCTFDRTVVEKVVISRGEERTQQLKLLTVNLEDLSFFKSDLFIQQREGRISGLAYVKLLFVREEMLTY